MKKICHQEKQYENPNQLLEFGCFSKFKEQTHCFLKRRQKSPFVKDQHRSVCKIYLQNSQKDSLSHHPACKVSLKRENVKTSIKSKEMKIICLQNSCFQGDSIRGSVDIPSRQCISQKFIYQDYSKKNFQDLPVKFGSQRLLQQVKQREYHPFKTQKTNNLINTTNYLPSEPQFVVEHPKITFHLGSVEKCIETPKFCQTDRLQKLQENQVNIQNKCLKTESLDIFVKDLNYQIKKQQKPVFSNFVSSKTAQRKKTNLTKDCSMQSLSPNSKDTINSNISQSSKERSMKSIQSDLSLLKNINDVGEVQSVADDNISGSDNESIVQYRLNMYSSQMLSSEPSIQNNSLIRDHLWRRLGRISAIVNGKS